MRPQVHRGYINSPHVFLNVGVPMYIAVYEVKGRAEIYTNRLHKTLISPGFLKVVIYGLVQERLAGSSWPT